MQTVSSFLAKKETGGRITIGSTVMVRFPNGITHSFTITSHAQSVSPEKGVISDQSPLGEALLGKTVGALVTYTVGGRKFSVEIVPVEPTKNE